MIDEFKITISGVFIFSGVFIGILCIHISLSSLPPENVNYFLKHYIFSKWCCYHRFKHFSLLHNSLKLFLVYHSSNSICLQEEVVQGKTCSKMTEYEHAEGFFFCSLSIHHFVYPFGLIATVLKNTKLYINIFTEMIGLHRFGWERQGAIGTFSH